MPSKKRFSKDKLKLLFLDILTDDLKARKEREEKVTREPYPELFRKKLGLRKEQFIVVFAHKKKFPNPKKYHGIIIGGSLENPVKGEEKLWMKKTYSFINKIIEKKIPLLGVCGGHQFIARALGQKVIYNPKGREFGTIQITLTKEGADDLLFKGIPKKFLAQLSHQCIVEKIDPKWQLLASSDICKVQAIAINEQTRTIQFHPEFSMQIMKAIAQIRKTSLIKENFITPKNFPKFLFSVKESTHAKKILKNFLNYFVISRWL